jgi:preprotein translocase subunit SecE
MANPISSLIDYLRSARAELEKVTWPSRQDTLRYSLLVVAVSIIMACFFAAIDFGLGQITTTLLAKRAATNASSTQTQQPAATVPDLQPIQAVDANGKSVPVQVTPINNDGSQGSTFQITPTTAPAANAPKTK